MPINLGKLNRQQEEEENKRYNGLRLNKVSSSALDIAKKSYDNADNALRNLSNYSNTEINNAIKKASSSKDYYKNRIIAGNTANNILFDENSQSLAPLNSLYRKQQLKDNYNNRYNQNNKYQRNNVISLASRADKNYSSAKNIFDNNIRNSDDYKLYEDYSYRALPILKEVKNQREVAEDKANFVDKIFAPFIGGLAEGTDKTFNSDGTKYRLADGKEVKLSTKAGLKGQKVMSESKSLPGKIYSSATYSLGNMVPSMVAGAINPVLGATVMGTGTYNQAYNNSLKEGYNEKQANNYAIANTTLELGLGKLLGGIPSVLGKSGLSNVISKSMSKVLSNKTTRDFLAEMGSEFTEEYLQEIIDPFVRNKILDEDNEVKLISEEALVAGLSGALTSGISNLPKWVASKNSLNNTDIQSQNTNMQNQMSLQDNNLNNDNVQFINDMSDNIFSKQVDEVLNGTFDKNNHMVVLEHTPQALQNLGVQDYPITLTSNKLDRIMNESGKQKGEYHNLGADIVKQIPEALQHPLDIVKSHNNSYVLTTYLSDKQNRQVIASIKIDGKGYIDNIEIDTNVMTSAYGRNNYDNWMKQNQDNENIVYDIDRGFLEQKKPATIPGLQLPNNSNKLSTDNITQSKDNVKLPINNDMQNYENNSGIPLVKNINKFSLPTEVQTNNNSSLNLNTLNPLQISNLTIEDANTTPKLPEINRNEVNDGNSKFYNNIKDKVGMLNEQQKHTIMSDEEVQYYDKITNKETLDKALKKMDGKYSTETWFGKESNNADAVDVAQGWILLKQYADNNDADGMVAVAKKMRDIGTKAGQTIQAFNIMERMTPEGMVKYAQSELLEAYDNIVKNKSKEWIDKYRSDFDLKPNEVQFIMDNMKEISKMKDGYDKKVKLAEIQKLMTDKLPPEKGNKIKSWMRISMLFNPKTQVRNVAGNAIIMPVNYFGDLFSSYADKIISKKTGTRTTGNMNVKAILKGFKEGAYQATNDYKKGINTKDMSGNRFEIGEGKSFDDKKLIGKSLNRVEGLLNYVMDAGDRIFSQSSFENSLQNQMILNNTTEITQSMIDIATQESLSRTWNDNNNYTRFVLGVRSGLNKIGIKGYGLGDILIPFAKTPANLTKAIVDYSPVGLVITIIQGNNLRKSLTNGQYTPQMQHKFVQSLGKATAGTMLYIAGYALAQAGITSGESDKDKDTANFLKNTLGISSYSIKIGDKSFTYDWAQPLAAPLSITANIVNSKSKETALLESIVGNLDTAGSILLEQSFLTSLNEVLNDNDGVVSGIEKQILNLPSRAVPTFSKQIADLVDGTQRTSYEYRKPINSAINSIKAKIPGLSKSLAPSVDTLGREIQKYGGKNNLFNVFLNPANVNTENISESASEIYRLYNKIGNANIMPRVAPYYINKNNEKIMLTSKQKAEYQKFSGKIIEDNVKQLLSTKEYKNMDDSVKSDVISNIVNYSYNIVQKELLGLELSQSYQKAYEYSKIGNISDYYLFKNSIDETNKKISISNYLVNSSLNDKELAFLYGNFYSSEEKLNNLLTMNIPIKEFIKLNSENITSDYSSKDGKTISGSKKKKIMEYINSLDLNVSQKAILIKMQYNSFNNYNNQIVNYVNGINTTANEKKVLLKSIGFDNYDKDVINYINSQNLSAIEKEKKLKSLGFTVRNGRCIVNES